MFLIREARPEDFSNLYPLAKLLDSYNLPADRSYLRELLRVSEQSFAGKLPKSKARYLFVLEDLTQRAGRLVGCSLIIAKHGTRRKPHLWLGLETVTRVSRTLGLSRRHPVLRLGYTENGPTEVGGFVVLPHYRKRPERCGLQLSFVRFLYMAMHPQRFEPQVLVEYRGASGTQQRFPFWEAMGRIFTGLDYAKADRLSVTNKEFILHLWPREPIYYELLPVSVQRLIGAIHPAAQRAANLLKTIGFRAIGQVEPFDAGPYYMANRSGIQVVRRTQRKKLFYSNGPFRSYFFIGIDRKARFRAVLTLGKTTAHKIQIPKEVHRLLRIREGEIVYVYPLSR